jgi:hypothetical protein
MRPQDVKKLLGGWSAGTLTEAECQALLNAALDDQELFNTLMAEQPLKELLADSSARAELLATLQEKPRRSAMLAWLLRPWPMAAAGAMVAALVTVVFLNSGYETAPVTRRQEPEMMARNIPAAPPVAPAPIEMPADRKRSQAPAVTSAVAPLPQPKPEPEPAQTLARVEEAPAQPELAPPLAKQKKAESVGVVGGVPGGTTGGVIGGIIGSVPGSMPPSPPTAQVYRNSLKASAERADRPAAAGISMRYTLQKRDADGVFREAAGGSKFAPGEPFIVSVEPSVSGILSVSEGGGQIYSRRVEAGQRYTIPANGTFEIGPDGKDRVLLVQIDQFSFPIMIPAKK